MQKEEAAIEAVKKGMGVLEKHLHSRTFLVGNSVTLADVVGACNLYWGYTKVSPHLTSDKPTTTANKVGNSVILANIVSTQELC